MSSVASGAPPQSGGSHVAELRGVSVTFPGVDGYDVLALDRVSLSIDPREIVCLVGPSGCGKTTAQNLLAGFVPASSGEVLVQDRAVRGPSPSRAVVFQNPTLFPWLTVERNITLGSRKRREPKSAYSAKAVQLMEAFGLGQFARFLPYQLSGGMKQRVQIARALMGDPTLLLMDEPFGALDSLTRLKMQEHLLGHRDAIDCSVLFITHDVDEALLLGDRVYVMTPRPGQIAAEVTVPFGRERSLSTFQRPEFSQLKSELLLLLHSGDRDEQSRELVAPSRA